MHRRSQARPRRSYLAAVLLILLTCSSCSISLPDLKKVEQQAEVFARDSVQEIGQHWDPKSLSKRADPSFMKESGDPSPLFKMFSEKLGPLKKIGSIHRETYNAFAGISTNRPDYVGLYKLGVDFESGPATVLIGVMHKDNNWSVNGFRVDSKLLDSMNQADRAESRAYVERMAPEFCRNLSVDLMRENADPVLAAEFKDNVKAMAAKGVFLAISKALGQFKKLNSPSSRGFTIYQGQNVYAYSAEAEFERGKATINILTVKHNGQWKLRAFNIQSHS